VFFFCCVVFPPLMNSFPPSRFEGAGSNALFFPDLEPFSLSWMRGIRSTSAFIVPPFPPPLIV